MAGMEITTAIGCSVSCNYCPQDKFIRAYAARSDLMIMKFDMFKSCIDKIPSSVNINFSGMCEPWKNAECTKMVEYACKKGHPVTVFTTLSGMSLSDVELLSKLKIKDFLVHLPSSEGTEKVYINDEYLDVLKMIHSSMLKVKYHVHGKKLNPDIIGHVPSEEIRYWKVNTRANNINGENSSLIRNKGVISCKRSLEQNVLLPNGDVLLCCMDYGMMHVIGNLSESDYGSLFESEEFIKVKKGLKEAGSDIICRYCEKFACDVDLTAKIFNRIEKHLVRFKKTINM